MNIKTLLSIKNIGILIVLIGVVVVLSFVGQKKEAPLAEKDKSCITLAGKGKQGYEIRTDNPSNLQIVRVEVDPIDVKMGEKQKIIVQVKDKGNSTITKRSGVTASIITDNKSVATAAFVMRLAEDSKDGSSLLTTWEGLWTRDDDYCRTYMETITAVNNKGEKDEVSLSFK